MVTDCQINMPNDNRSSEFNHGSSHASGAFSDSLRRVVCILFSLGLTSVSSLPQTVKGSAVVAVMTGTEIAVAADSLGEFSDKGNSKSINFCKIRQIENAFFVCAGLVKVDEVKYDAYTVIPEGVKGSDTFAGKVAAAENKLMPTLTQAMRYLKHNRTEEFEREYEGKPAVTFMLFGVENQTLRFAMRQFSVRTVNSNEVSISMTKTDWPESSVKPLIAYAGRVEEIRAYLAQHNSFETIRPSELARFLVTMEIIERLDVRGPIDVLSIDRTGNPSWMERKPGCERVDGYLSSSPGEETLRRK